MLFGDCERKIYLFVILLKTYIFVRFGCIEVSFLVNSYCSKENKFCTDGRKSRIRR